MKPIHYIPSWEELDDEQRKNLYYVYKYEARLEHGDNVQVRSYEEWCKDSEALGKADV